MDEPSPPFQAPPPPGEIREDPAGQLRDLLIPQPPVRALSDSAWKSHFTGSVQTIVFHLMDGDPLELRQRCAERLSARRLVIHPDRLCMRAVVRVALLAMLQGPPRSLEEFVRRRIDFSIRELLLDDYTEELAGRPIPEDDLVYYLVMADAFGVELPLARRAALHFDVAPEAVRRTLWALCLEGKSLAQAAAEGLGAEVELERHLRQGLGVLSRLDPVRTLDPEAFTIEPWEHFR